ncbi:hypothetical protein CDV31_017185 [Fusarium ambrosium]|uniref:Uncharacterized protein n=1 Tax=Fusarium ambrosium TaxID=131363 RepID=A0A428RQ40_9HYPO|nr:hypothetical protein CDV31_017185 [Fusarium ambrosium]
MKMTLRPPPSEQATGVRLRSETKANGRTRKHGSRQLPLRDTREEQGERSPFLFVISDIIIQLSMHVRIRVRL